MSHFRPAAWIGRHILAALERLFETKVDPIVCDLSNKLSEGRDD